MAQIKNVLFDLGGVLLDIDYQRTLDAFIALGFEHFENMYTQYSADKLFDKLETGHISNQDFYTQILKKAPAGLEENNIREAWNAMLLTFRADTLPFIKNLSKTHAVYLLSNTNAVHLEAVHQIIKRDTGITDFDSYFTKAYYSNLIGYRKPNADAFEFILDDAGLKAEETIFIDDSYNNIDAAAALGFRTHLLLPSERIQAALGEIC